MFAATIVLFVLCSMTCTTTTADETTTVTHEWRASIIVSPSLLYAVDRRLLFAADGLRIFMPRSRRSPNAVLIALLLLRGGVESNPGPVVNARHPGSKGIKLGLLNTRSVVHKAAVIHDIVRDEKLDIIALTETWIPADAPNAVKLDVAPPGYSICHQPRQPSSGKTRGGGVAVICRETLKMSPAFDFSSTEFESLAVNVKVDVGLDRLCLQTCTRTRDDSAVRRTSRPVRPTATVHSEIYSVRGFQRSRR